ncbi:MAG: hypothetical protein AAFU67_02230 [Bacteroidota bacterium]
MKRILFVCCLFAAFGLAAQNNFGLSNQTGNNNNTTIDQNGNTNVANAVTTGNSNEADLIKVPLVLLTSVRLT